jgi:hypothetical protein
MSVEDAILRRETIVEFISRVMKKDQDYGVIPGTTKDTLFKPGAEKLCNLFGLSPRYEIIHKVEDFLGDDYKGEPFLYYISRCYLYRGELLISSSDGSCNSWEKRYRYRQAERVCPVCKAPAIIRGRAEYGGGWLCFGKRGGCGAKFSDGDKAIEGQETGLVPNKDVADLANTILKMSQKRCLAGSVPLLVKTPRNIVRTDVRGLYEILQKATGLVQVPGIGGEWRTVIGILKQDNKSVVRIETADGSVIRATNEHRFQTLSGLKEVSSLQVGDSLIRADLPIFKGRAALPELGWIAGLFIAEGHFATETCTKFTLSSDEHGFVNRIAGIAKMVGATINVHQRHDAKVLDVDVHGYSFAGIIRQFVDGERSYGKHVSRFAWSQGVPFLSALLDGYLNGDGSRTVKGSRNEKIVIGFTGQNSELAYDLRTLAALCGYRICLKNSKSKCKGVEYPTWSGWVAKHNITHNIADSNEIVSISEEPVKRCVYDIEVDGDHLFCLANGIVSHNSLIAAVLLATSASEFYTQDFDDTIDASLAPTTDEVPPVPKESGKNSYLAHTSPALHPHVEEEETVEEHLREPAHPKEPQFSAEEAQKGFYDKAKREYDLSVRETDRLAKKMAESIPGDWGAQHWFLLTKDGDWDGLVARLRKHREKSAIGEEA